MFLLVDKPKGITSFDVIRVLRRTLDIKKIGHGGTLDPMATWGMILATDQDTKKLTGLIWLDKSYEATIDLSKTSDTWDADYREQYEEIKVEKQPSKEEIETLLKSLVPEHILPLPPFSAKKKEGKKWYEEARKGRGEIREQLMKIHEIQLIAYTFPEVKIKVTVGSWTYIRSIAYRLGKQCWCWWILTQLRRTRIGKYTMKEIKNWEEVKWEIRHQETTIKYSNIEQ